MKIESYIRNIPDFPKPGIGFKDITTLLINPDAFKASIKLMCEPFRKQKIDKIVGIEARGFIFGSAMAIELEAGFIPARKPGKLPAEKVSESYTLEYGEDAIEIHIDSIAEKENILIVDDLLATGGTMAATLKLVKKMGGNVIAAVFLIELSFINGRTKLQDVPVHSLITYDSE